MFEYNEKYMQRCFDLAILGRGHVSPNPMVGAVIVHDNKIIGEGYHRKIGEAHAEVNAIASVKDTDLLKDSTIYVSLEPCVHYGKTPPCTDLIISKKIPRVVIAMTDPNPLVGGKGIEKLRKNGVEVISGIFENEAKFLNRRFIKYITTDRPYIILKWAKTIDGFIDASRQTKNKDKPKWITNSFCKKLVHKWRTEEDAFMVGTQTARMDNPQLTSREWSGKNPIRVSIDFDEQLPKDLFIFDNQAHSIIFTGQTESKEKNIKRIKISSRKDNLSEILSHLHKEHIQSLVVEGGAALLKSFIDNELWDEARIFTGNHYFCDGVKSPSIKGDIINTEHFGNSSLDTIINQ
jgi:diaminohydroxyphosphoribosylaminopyrimidine deaminase/5-amino-6-(5-phosphoribosylamino)uracil reductase